MKRIKEGFFCVDTKHGIVDVKNILEDPEELKLLKVIKEEMDVNYPDSLPNTGTICIKSICAFLSYIDTLCFFNEEIDENTQNWH